jgi:anti-sigma regulatory factor (Ser/Thr protein kinase)
LQTIAVDALRERKTLNEARIILEAEPEFLSDHSLSYEHLVDLKEILKRIMDNAVKHGFESSYERVLRHKNASSEIHLSLKASSQGVILHIQDDGRGLGIRRLREWAHDDRLLDKDKGSDLQYYAKLLMLKAWRAPRGLSEVVMIAERLEAKTDIVLYPERIRDGHCPFAIEIVIPWSLIKSKSKSKTIPSSAHHDRAG